MAKGKWEAAEVYFKETLLSNRRSEDRLCEVQALEQSGCAQNTSVFKTRKTLVAENLVLRQHLEYYQLYRSK